ncbi:hypothetical protein EWM64_g2081 [Hericium alpestre]|uniref:XPA C-terminal domain-containing protein n=1 Tax=Hericium alpestre TaxID=135208 RepID=A0A4Z0A4G5_9AGAM|nr:hypothetical protein EWM64_g2081 [Hericium alpestre]
MSRPLRISFSAAQTGSKQHPTGPAPSTPRPAEASAAGPAVDIQTPDAPKGKKRARDAKTSESENEKPQTKKRRAAATGSKGKGRARPEAQEEINPSTWPPSKLSPDMTISKGLAKDWYKLTHKDLKPLSFVVDGNREGYPMHLYKAVEVEHAAWQKYGGPDGFEEMLKKKEAEWKVKRPKKPFLRPSWKKVKRCRDCGGGVKEDDTGFYKTEPRCDKCEAEAWFNRPKKYIQFDPNYDEKL